MPYRLWRFALCRPLLASLSLAAFMLAGLASGVWWALLDRDTYFTVKARTEIVTTRITIAESAGIFLGDGFSHGRGDGSSCFNGARILPPRGSRVIYQQRAAKDAPVTIAVVPPENAAIVVFGDGATATAAGPLFLVENWKCRAGGDAGTPARELRLPLSGDIVIGRMISDATDVQSGMAPVLLNGEVRLFVRAKMGAGFYPAGAPVPLPPGGIVLADGDDDDGSASWAGFVARDPAGGLALFASTATDRLRMVPPGAGGTSAELRASVFARSFRDPSLQPLLAVLGSVFAVLLVSLSLTQALSESRAAKRERGRLKTLAVTSLAACLISSGGAVASQVRISFGDTGDAPAALGHGFVFTDPAGICRVVMPDHVWREGEGRDPLLEAPPVLGQPAVSGQAIEVRMLSGGLPSAHPGADLAMGRVVGPLTHAAACRLSRLGRDLLEIAPGQRASLRTIGPALDLTGRRLSILSADPRSSVLTFVPEGEWQVRKTMSGSLVVADDGTLYGMQVSVELVPTAIRMDVIKRRVLGAITAPAQAFAPPEPTDTHPLGHLPVRLMDWNGSTPDAAAGPANVLSKGAGGWRALPLDGSRAVSVVLAVEGPSPRRVSGVRLMPSETSNAPGQLFVDVATDFDGTFAPGAHCQRPVGTGEWTCRFTPRRARRIRLTFAATPRAAQGTLILVPAIALIGAP